MFKHPLTKRTATAALSLITLLSSLTQSRAETLTSFQTQNNYPGFLEIDMKDSVPFHGFVKNQWPSDGIDRRTISEVLFEKFNSGGSRRSPLLLKGGAINPKALAELNKEIAEVELGRKIVIVSEGGLREKGETDEQVFAKSEFQEKWAKSSDRVTIEFARQQLRSAFDLAAQGDLKITDNSSQNSALFQEFIERLSSALTVIEALPDNSPETGRMGERFKTKSLINSFFRPTISSQRPEANNLDFRANQSGQILPLTPESKFVSGDHLKAYGVDVSLLDPVESGLWQKPKWDINEFDMSNYHKLIADEFEGKLTDPTKEAELIYKPSRSAGKTPKLTGLSTEIISGAGKPRGVKLKFDVEINNPGHGPLDIAGKVFGITGEAKSESVANNIAAALGFTVNPTFYKKSVRLYLEAPGKNTIKSPNQAETALREIVNFIKSTGDIAKKEEMDHGQDLTNPGYLPWVRNIENVLNVNKLKKDPKKGWYVQISSASLELKSDVDTDISIGSYSQTGLGRQFLREHRASLLLRAILGDSDIKQSNSEVRLVKKIGAQTKGPESYSLAFSLADLGSSFGNHAVKNSPNEYLADLLLPQDIHLNKSGEGSLTLNYKTNYTLRALESLTLADAKWLLRRMGQITREQLIRSFLAAEYPEAVAQVLSDKFLNRRDQLIAALFPNGLTVKSDRTRTDLTIKAKKHFDANTYTLAGFESCIMRGGGTADLIPCEQVEARWALSISNRFFLPDENGLLTPAVDAYGKAAPQNVAMQEVNGKMIEWAFKGLKHTIQHVAIPIPFTSRKGTPVNMDVVTGGVVRNRSGLKVEGIIPYFAQVHNPDLKTSKDFPYWNIEAITIRVPYSLYTDYSGAAVREKLGFDPGVAVRNGPKLKIGPAAYWVKEFVRVTPSSLLLGLPALPDTIIDIKNGQPIRRISDALIDGMRKAPVGAAIFSNLYLDVGAKFKVNPSTFIPFLSTAFGLAAPGIQASAGVHYVQLKGLGVVKSDDSTLLSIWDNTEKLAARAGIGLAMLTEHFPIFQADAEVLTRKSPTYAFNIEDQEAWVAPSPVPSQPLATRPDSSETVVLKKYINSLSQLKVQLLGTAPSKDDKEMNPHLQEVTTIKKKSWSFLASFLGIVTGSREQTRISAKSEKPDEQRNLKTDKLFVEAFRASKKDTLSGASSFDNRVADIKIDALTKEITASYRVDVEVKFAEPKHMKALQQKYGSILPAEFEWLKSSQVSRYLGTLRLQSMESFNQEAIEDLFKANPDRNTVCLNALKGLLGLVEESANDLCHDIFEINSPIEFAKKWEGTPTYGLAGKETFAADMLRNMHFMIRTFSSNLMSAQKAFSEVKSNESPSEKDFADLSHRLLAVFNNNSVQGLVLQMIRSQVQRPEKSIRKDILLTSSLGGLAGEQGIELHARFRGRVATSLDLYGTVEELVPTKLDLFRTALSGIFYDYLSHEGIKKRRGMILQLFQKRL